MAEQNFNLNGCPFYHHSVKVFDNFIPYKINYKIVYLIEKKKLIRIQYGNFGELTNILRLLLLK